jgi:hypothetical protein
MSEWRSCFTCLGKVCGCRKRSNKNGKVGDINFSVTNEIKVEVTTQGKNMARVRNVKWIGLHPCVLSMRNPKLTVGLQNKQIREYGGILG